MKTEINQKFRIRLQVFKRNSLEMNLTKNKGHREIEIAVNFTQEVPLKFTRIKKMISAIISQKSTTKTVKFGTIFEKGRLSSMILKIVGASPQLDQNFRPARKVSGQFFIYI